MSRKAHALSLFLTLILMLSLALPAFAAEEPIIITRQPQNRTYPQESTAIYSVEAVGENLKYTWYIVVNGKLFNTSKAISEGEKQGWMKYVFGDIGTNETGNSFYMNGIQSGMTGAEIYCEITDGKGNKATSNKAIVSVSAFGSGMPPTITVPSAMTVKKGTPLDLYCGAEASDGSALTYLWYETESGSLKDIIAIDRGAETSDTLHCDTDKVGTRYYVCGVIASKGGSGYSSVIAVNVTENDLASTPETSTSITTEPTQDDSSEPSPADKPDTTLETDKTDSASSSDTTPTSKDIEEDGVFSWWMIAVPAVCIAAIVAGVILAAKKSLKDNKTNK